MNLRRKDGAELTHSEQLTLGAVADMLNGLEAEVAFEPQKVRDERVSWLIVGAAVIVTAITPENLDTFVRDLVAKPVFSGYIIPMLQSMEDVALRLHNVVRKVRHRYLLADLLGSDPRYHEHARALAGPANEDYLGYLIATHVPGEYTSVSSLAEAIKRRVDRAP